MLRGDAALPFKDVIRSFDKFTMSIIHSLVQFNRKFNPKLAPDGEYDIIARGATSLMAKELRGMQADSMVQVLKPEQMIEIDMRKLTSAQLKARDMDDILLSEDDSKRAHASQDATNKATADQQQNLIEAQIREGLASAFNKIAQAQKNTAVADAATVDAALQLMEKGVQNAVAITKGAGGIPAGDPTAQPDQPGGGSPGGIAGPQAGGGQAPAGGQSAPTGAPAPGAGAVP
jgi:hypothetical protein